MTDLHERMKAAGGGLPPPPFTVDDLADAGRRQVRRRRWLVGTTGAVGAVVAVAAMVTTMSGTPIRTPAADPPAEPAARPAPPFAVTFAGYRSREYRVADPAVVTPGYAAAGVFRGSDQVGMLTAYRPGVFRPAPPTGAGPVDIAGRPGFSYTNEQVLGRNSSGTVAWDSVRVSALAWEVSTDTWATIESFGTLPDAATRALATGFRPVDSGPARIPYRVGHLPSGYRLVQAGTWGRLVDANDAALGGSVYQRVAPAFAGLTGVVEFEGPSSTALLITVAKSDRDGTQNRRLRPKCLPANPRSGVICEKAIEGEGFDVRVDDRSRNLPVAEVERILDSVRPADLDDPATWIPA